MSSLTGEIMNEKIIVKKKIQRKKFFASLGVSVLGVTMLSSFPFNIFNSSYSAKNNIDNQTTGKIKVHLNPLAVNRKKIGEKNA